MFWIWPIAAYQVGSYFSCFWLNSAVLETVFDLTVLYMEAAQVGIHLQKSPFRSHIENINSVTWVICLGFRCTGDYTALIGVFPKIRGTMLGVPYNKDYSILGSILGSLT